MRCLCWHTSLGALSLYWLIGQHLIDSHRQWPGEGRGEGSGGRGGEDSGVRGREGSGGDGGGVERAYSSRGIREGEDLGVI